jgi:hypothetical protein
MVSTPAGHSTSYPPSRGRRLDWCTAFFSRRPILTLGAGGGVTRRGYWPGPVGVGRPFHQGPGEYVGRKMRRFTFKILLNIQVPPDRALRSRADPGAQRPTRHRANRTPICAPHRRSKAAGSGGSIVSDTNSVSIIRGIHRLDRLHHLEMSCRLLFFVLRRCGLCRQWPLVSRRVFGRSVML